MKRNREERGRFGLIFLGAIISVVTLCAAPASANGPTQLYFHGFFDLNYLQASANEGHSRPGASDATNGAFDVHHFNLLLDATVSSELVLKGHFEFDHGADTERDLGGVILEYGFAEYTFNDLLVVRAGKTLTPFGIYNETHDSSPTYLSVLPPWNIYKANTLGGFNFIPKWNTGLTVIGETSLFAAHHDLFYTIYIGNGESIPGTNDSQFDDNPNKAVGGQLRFSTHNEEVTLIYSFFYGDKALSSSNTEVQHATSAFSLLTELGGIELQGEFAVSSLGSDVQSGWFIQAAYRAGWGITPYLRYQTFNPADDVLVGDPGEDEEEIDQGSNYWNTLVIGVNWMATDHLFLKLEYNQHERGIENAAIIDLEKSDFSEIRAGLTLFF